MYQRIAIFGAKLSDIGGWMIEGNLCGAMSVTVRHMYAATAVSAKGQFQGLAAEGCAQGRQTACVYRELLLLPSFFFFSP
jgi:hypothetical protein